MTGLTDALHSSTAKNRFLSGYLQSFRIFLIIPSRSQSWHMVLVLFHLTRYEVLTTSASTPDLTQLHPADLTKPRAYVAAHTAA